MDIAQITAQITLAVINNRKWYTTIFEEYGMKDDNKISKLFSDWAKDFVESKTELSLEAFIGIKFYEMEQDEDLRNFNYYQAVIGDIMAHYGGDWTWDGQKLIIKSVDMPEYEGAVYAETAWVTKLYDFWRAYHTEL